MKISVVTTLYKSKIFLEEFISEIQKSLNQIQCSDYELIFVNDGSPDDSLAYLLSKRKSIPQIKIIDLSRNFGHHYAIQAGLSYSSGDYILLIDNDLETSPSILIDFYKEINNDKDLDVIYGYQETRRGGFITKITGNFFWYMINKLSDTKIPYNILTERLMTRNYVNSLLSLGDANLFIGGMMYWVGYNQKGIPVEKGMRKGPSTYSFKRRMSLMLEAITSFSGKPLEWLFYFGFLISFLSGFFILYIMVKKIIYPDVIQMGWTSIIAINVLILGIISTFLGLIGIYINKIFKQVQGRPNAIIKKIYE